MIISLFASTGFADGIGYGLPFFRNFTSKEYGAHNRNFDIECGENGRVFVANFQGLLVYDGYDWDIYRSRDKYRVTSLKKMHDGRIWFGGYDVLGYAEPSGDSIRVCFISDNNNQGKILKSAVNRIWEEKNGNVFFSTEKNEIFTVTNGTIRNTGKKQVLAPNSTELVKNLSKELHVLFQAIPGKGLLAKDDNGSIIYTLGESNGLCSNNITDLAYDDMGGIWGTTDNGIFVVNASPIYTRFGEKEGLKGQVTCILNIPDNLLVGTLQGLFLKKGNSFERISATSLAVWQMAKAKDGSVLVASAMGVVRLVNGYNYHQLSSRHTLSLYVEDDGTFLAGALDGLYRYTLDGHETLIDDSIRNVSHIEKDDKGGLWLKSLDDETFYRAKRGDRFVRRDNKNISILLKYRDDRNFLWHAKPNGKGLVMNGNKKALAKWLEPFDNLEIQALLVDDGVAWLGGTFGLDRLDLTLTTTARINKLHAFIRDLRLINGDLTMAIATDRNAPLSENLYSYRLRNQDKWSSWSEKNALNFNKLSYGSYNITVRVMDPFGNIATSKTIRFEIPFPWYLRWYSILFYIIAFSALIYLTIRWRIHRMKMEQARLEQIVSKRTAQLNEANGELSTALKELKEAQGELIRQEKEASIGKLTKGLIDRILNPMNYINNFSHLCLGLLKDVNEDLESLTPQSPSPKGEGETADNYESQMDAIEDLHDVMGMMQQNLDKIEQHGVATTRILKAMEEMLKERGGKVEAQDIAMLCQTNVDMLHKYYAEDIRNMGIQIEWQKPEYPIVSDVVAEELSKVIMSMLGNSIYAVKKKWEKCMGKDYNPMVKVEIIPSSGTEPPTLHIWDNGIGIEESILDKIFDPFFTTKPTGDAPGVGLYLSRRIIEDVGGKITVESVKNEWTEFCISLP